VVAVAFVRLRACTPVSTAQSWRREGVRAFARSQAELEELANHSTGQVMRRGVARRRCGIVNFSYTGSAPT
jgi:hypothetical protein